jgi:hypothetical protein
MRFGTFGLRHLTAPPASHAPSAVRKTSISVLRHDLN